MTTEQAAEMITLLTTCSEYLLILGRVVCVLLGVALFAAVQSAFRV
jgi:hypothetical protein